MAQRDLSRELIGRKIDEEPCAWCGRWLPLGSVAYYCTRTGVVYCTADCARDDRAILIPVRRPRHDAA